MANTIFKLIMETHNPSANKDGYFSTRELVEKEKERWIKTVKQDIKNSSELEPPYYVNDIDDLIFEIEEIQLDSGID